MTSEVAFISDIHGNLQALDAVIADTRERRISECFCLGDIVGYGGKAGLPGEYAARLAHGK